MYPAPEVSRLIDEAFIPVRFHIKENSGMWHRFDVRWTPTVLILGWDDGSEARRIEGFLPTDEFLGQLELGLGDVAMEHKDWTKAQRYFAHVAGANPETDAAAEGEYWSGVAKYSGSHDPDALEETARRFTQKHQRSSWAKRASVWTR